MIRNTVCTVLLTLGVAFPVAAAELKGNIDLKVKGAIRHSDENSLPVAFPIGAQLKTVDPGTHTDITAVELKGSVRYGDQVSGRAKLDIVDRYDRNPTTTDKEVDVDELWLRVGKEAQPWQLPEEKRGYVKVGKFEKFERQDDRHLESYGLVSTAFNRFEDSGVEVGADICRNFYVRGSYTTGNPLFMRDPNALAGDHGTKRVLLTGKGEYNQGYPILYDSEVEDGDFESEYAEVGGGVGVRWATEDQSLVINGMVFAYKRDMQDEVDMHGSVYGGDMDILTAPSIDGEPGSEPTRVWGVDGDEKEEWGANLWVYWDAVTLFAQYVDQEAAGLGREGLEVEASYRIDHPEAGHSPGPPERDAVH